MLRKSQNVILCQCTVENNLDRLVLLVSFRSLDGSVNCSIAKRNWNNLPIKYLGTPQSGWSTYSLYKNTDRQLNKTLLFLDSNEFRSLEWNVEKVERHWLSTKQIRFVVRSWMGECFWYQSLTVGCLYRTAETSAGYNYCLLKIVLILAVYHHQGKYI